jgi:hypothetical protein
MILIRVLLALTLFAAAGAASAQDQPTAQRIPSRFDRDALPRDTVFINSEGVSRRAARCGAPPIDSAAREAIEADIARVLEIAHRSDRKAREIPVVVHVIRSRRNGHRVGDVSDDRIEEQIRVLNRAYERTGIEFTLKRVNRVNKRRWYSGCARWYVEDQMKAKLAVSPSTTLNVYTCDSDVLGYAWFPWDFPAGDVLHGVVVNHETLPGGAAAPFNEGDTVVHEVGHYLGLLHTFDGGCSPGDEVADTAAESSPAFGCPRTRDTCRGGGRDPVDNFMDYTDDACMDSFSAGQARRITAVLDTYRPGR